MTAPARTTRRRRALLARASSASSGMRRDGDELRPLGKKATRTRNALLAAAYDCFIDAGFWATSVQDIHEAADVSLGTFYQYFRDKSDVMATIVGVTILGAVDVVFPEVRLTERGPDDLVTGFVRYYADTADFQGVWEEVTHFDAQLAELRWDLSSIIESGLRDTIATAQADGVVDPSLDPQTAAVALIAMVDRHCYRVFVVDHRRDTRSVEQTIATLSLLWRNALGLD